MGLDHRFGQTGVMSRSRQGVFGSPASCLSDSEFLPGWKKYPGVAETTFNSEKYKIKTGFTLRFFEVKPV
jgi:hypothetical protein